MKRQIETVSHSNWYGTVWYMIVKKAQSAIFPFYRSRSRFLSLSCARAHARVYMFVRAVGPKLIYLKQLR